MKQLSSEESQEYADILWALARPDALQIVQYLQTHTDAATETQLAEALHMEGMTIQSDVTLLAEVGVLLRMEYGVLGDPDARPVLINPNMPELAQTVFIEIWPDWFSDLTTHIPPLLDLSGVAILDSPPSVISSLATPY